MFCLGKVFIERVNWPFFMMTGVRPYQFNFVSVKTDSFWHSHDSKCHESTRCTRTHSCSIARLDGASVLQLIMLCPYLKVTRVSNEIKLSPGQYAIV